MRSSARTVGLRLPEGRRSKLRKHLTSRRPGEKPKSDWKVAIFAAVFGLLGTAVGGGITYVIANNQIEASQAQVRQEAQTRSDEAQAEFLRTQRQGAYSAFISSLTAARGAKVDYRTAFSVYEPDSTQKLETAYRADNQAMLELERSMSTVILVSPKYTADAAQQAFLRHQNLTIALNDFYIQAILNGSPEVYAQAQQKFDELMPELLNWSNSFISEAQNDLGSKADG